MAEERYIAREDGCTFAYAPELLKKPGRRIVTKAEAEELEASKAGRRMRAMAEELEPSPVIVPPEYFEPTLTPAPTKSKKVKDIDADFMAREPIAAAPKAAKSTAAPSADSGF